VRLCRGTQEGCHRVGDGDAILRFLTSGGSKVVLDLEE
jgi:hypothetical protein